MIVGGLFIFYLPSRSREIGGVRNTVRHAGYWGSPRIYSRGGFTFCLVGCPPTMDGFATIEYDCWRSVAMIFDGDTTQTRPVQLLATNNDDTHLPLTTNTSLTLRCGQRDLQENHGLANRPDDGCGCFVLPLSLASRWCLCYSSKQDYGLAASGSRWVSCRDRKLLEKRGSCLI